MPNSKDVLGTSSSDSSLEEEAAETKKRKKERASKLEKKLKTEAKPSKEMEKSAGHGREEEDMFQIGKMRYVRVSCFKGKVLVDIREFYTDKEGDMKPGRKGIALSAEQWNQLKEMIPEIDAAVKKL
ncbi:activated RNA polymerase II transcriptional coactivator p15-like [Cuculus canorus]|uniref:activated RNA polymerase II transcriptional coactivator p15-like n=1 Tax=Cuculus canorus TaxID=55661 RepID=UPI0023AA743A|nr:activated RNA polymerase II transcriptional coactivator p15-like [Cuculus canorus]XP_053906026.1 activated RNA polymerase II transcriptional coactivator p15-like [Cuculus canorus]XP_053906027.1 activated RNA polymerase II transcriptional coactivator p15-like [Cuculus canorus]XP_053906029.1 activated RNA polymerase II transcriptional coactivator p15-like [Cuculus canorus]